MGNIYKFDVKASLMYCKYSQPDCEFTGESYRARERKELNKRGIGAMFAPKRKPPVPLGLQAPTYKL